MHLFPCPKYFISKALFVTMQAWSSEWSISPCFQRRWPRNETRNKKQPKKTQNKINQVEKTRENISLKAQAFIFMVCIMMATNHMKLRAVFNKSLDRIPDVLSSSSTETPISGFNTEIREVWDSQLFSTSTEYTISSTWFYLRPLLLFK